MKNPIEISRQINGTEIIAIITFQTHADDGKEIIDPPCCVAYRQDNDPIYLDGIFLKNEDNSLKWYQSAEEAAEAAFTEAFKVTR